MVHHLGVVAGLDHSMTSKDDETTAASKGRSSTTTAVEEGRPSATETAREFRLPRNSLDKELAEQLVAQAREDGVNLVGADGLLSRIVGQLMETALEVEITDHLGYERHARSDSANSRNGKSSKTLQTDVGPVTINTPRDRDGNFDPVIVPKHSRRLSGFDEQVLSLYAKGFTTGDIVDHVADIYGSQVSKDLVTKVTDAVLDELGEWQSRPLDPVWPVLFLDAIYVKIRDGQVSNRPIYVAMGINVAGERDVLGMWVGTGGESSKHWAGYLTELANRGISDVMIVACDGLPGLPEAIEATWPQAQVQTCVVHLVRGSLRYASKADWSKITADLKAVYTASTLDAAEARWLEFADKWADRYPAIIGLWERSWEQFTPFLDFPVELRKLIYTTNAIESLNSRFRQAVRRRGHFPHEQAAMKVLYLCVKRRDKNRSNPTGRVPGWKKILNTLVVTYGERIETAIK
jgi:putative transposase